MRLTALQRRLVIAALTLGVLLCAYLADTLGGPLPGFAVFAAAVLGGVYATV